MSHGFIGHGVCVGGRGGVDGQIAGWGTRATKEGGAGCGADAICVRAHGARWGEFSHKAVDIRVHMRPPDPGVESLFELTQQQKPTAFNIALLSLKPT